MRSGAAISDGCCARCRGSFATTHAPGPSSSPDRPGSCNGARLAAASPWVVLLALSMQPEVIGRYRSAAGVAVLTIGAVGCLVAYRLMVRLGRLPEQRRVLQ